MISTFGIHFYYLLSHCGFWLVLFYNLDSARDSLGVLAFHLFVSKFFNRYFVSDDPFCNVLFLGPVAELSFLDPLLPLIDLVDGLGSRVVNSSCFCCLHNRHTLLVDQPYQLFPRFVWYLCVCFSHTYYCFFSIYICTNIKCLGIIEVITFFFSFI